MVSQCASEIVVDNGYWIAPFRAQFTILEWMIMEHTVATSMSTKLQKLQRYDLDMFEVQRGYQQ